jgi:hypothetical protein
MPKKPVAIATRAFDSRGEANAFFKEMLNRYKPGARVAEEDALNLGALLERHSEYQEKVGGDRMKKRREFITLLGGAAAWPLVAHAQQPGMAVVGYPHPSSPEPYAIQVDAFRRWRARANEQLRRFLRSWIRCSPHPPS